MTDLQDMVPDGGATKVNMEVSVGILHTHQAILLYQRLFVWTAMKVKD